MHAGLVNAYGVGILIGESGVGKSEAALELIKRGHQLVADDVVVIRRVTDNRLVGTAPETVRHFYGNPGHWHHRYPRHVRHFLGVDERGR